MAQKNIPLRDGKQNKIWSFFNSKKFDFGCLPLIIFGIIITGSFIFRATPALPDPLPDYPGATKLASNATLTYELLDSNCYTLEAFYGKKYQAFVTLATKGEIKAFYQDAAAKRGFDFVGDEHFFESSPDYVSDAFCFSSGVTGPMFSGELPALAVRVLDWGSKADAGFIAQYFHEAPPKMNVVLLLQGFKTRSVG